MSQLEITTEIARKEYFDQVNKMKEIEEKEGKPTDKDFEALRQKWRALEIAGAHLSPQR